MNNFFFKKYWGQHFLKNLTIAYKISSIIDDSTVECIVEIGSGKGVLTQYLLEKDLPVLAIEIDKSCVEFLKTHFNKNNLTVMQGDFLKMSAASIISNFSRIAIIGNFPYNISSQILFKTIQMRDTVIEFSGMFQKEVAKRICAPHGNKTYGILSVMTQAYFDTKYLFSVPKEAFSPPPKVESGVISLKRKENYKLDCDEKLFTTIVKSSFNHRRKTLRNSLSILQIHENLKENPIFDLRPEQLSVEQFISLTKAIEHNEPRFFKY